MTPKRFLHAGCGTARKDRTTPYFASEAWLAWGIRTRGYALATVACKSAMSKEDLTALAKHFPG